MQLEWNTLQEHARANRATVGATLLAMRRAHVRNGQDGELEAWFLETHGVAEVARAVVVSQECGVYGIGDDSAQDGCCFGVSGRTHQKNRRPGRSHRS